MEKPKQIIVMRTDLGMRKGKMIAQGAHASMAFLARSLGSLDDTAFGPTTSTLTDVEREWLRGSFTKVCVRADSLDELLDIDCAALKAGITSHLITDAGLTEFHDVPTITCLALGPDLPAVLNPITGHLKLL